MNHFRGTNSPSTYKSWYGLWILVYQSSGNPSGPWSNHQIWIIQGTFGTNYQAGNNWSNVVLFVILMFLQKMELLLLDGMAQMLIQNSGWVLVKIILFIILFQVLVLVQDIYITTNNNTNINMSGTWNITMQT